MNEKMLEKKTVELSMNENANVFETSRKKTIRIICESVYKNNLKDF